MSEHEQTQLDSRVLHSYLQLPQDYSMLLHGRHSTTAFVVNPMLTSATALSGGNGGSASAVMTVRQPIGSIPIPSLALNVRTRSRRMVAAT